MSAKLAKYDRLYEQIKGYVQTTDDIWARAGHDGGRAAS